MPLLMRWRSWCVVMRTSVLTFETTTVLLKAERCLQRHAVPHRLVPAPRRLTSDCGTAIVVEGATGREIHGLLERNGVRCALHEMEESDGV
jgi:hypothetical protein